MGAQAAAITSPSAMGAPQWARTKGHSGERSLLRLVEPCWPPSSSNTRQRQQLRRHQLPE
eukprot:8975614-Pyramimonas_sp.AAC.1